MKNICFRVQKYYSFNDTNQRNITITTQPDIKQAKLKVVPKAYEDRFPNRYFCTIQQADIQELILNRFFKPLCVTTFFTYV